MDVKMNSEKVESLCFPLLFPHGEAGYTNNQKDHISPSQYVIARMLRPEKIDGKWMTAPARHLHNPQIIDRCTGEPFESYEDIDQEGQHLIITCQHLRVNQFMLMDRLAQYLSLEYFSRICNQRLSIIGHMRDRIMMVQPWQKRIKYSADEDMEEEEWCGAGYIIQYVHHYRIGGSKQSCHVLTESLTLTCYL